MKKIILVPLLFILTILITKNVSAANDYTCGDVGGTCSLQSCSDQEYNNNDYRDYCRNQLGNPEYGISVYCCYNSSDIETCSASTGAECADTNPDSSSFTVSTNNKKNLYCKIKYGRENCWEPKQTTTPTSTGGGNCPGACSTTGTTLAGYELTTKYTCIDGSNCFLGCTNKGYKCVDESTSTECDEMTAFTESCDEDELCCADSSGSSTPTAGSGTGIDVPKTNLPDSTISEILVNLLDWILTVFLVLSLLAFAITGIQFLLSRSSSYGGGMEKAKKNFEYAILAVALVGASVVIIKAIDAILRVKTVI